jgi:hypothetical protein
VKVATVMKKLLLTTAFAASLVFAPRLYAQNYIRNTVIIDMPTAYTIGRGTYQVSMLGYDNGGIEMKAFIGLHDNLFLGVSFDVQKAIGKDETEPNVPGVIAKLKITDGWEMFPISIALGYDSFFIGEQGTVRRQEAREEDPGYYSDNELNRMIYGPYFVVTKPIYLFDDEQHISFGMRVPTQPNYVPEDTSYFMSLDIPLGGYFVFKMEGERVYYDFSRPDEWLGNLGLRYTYMDNLGIELGLLFQHDEPVNRVVRVDYRSTF